MNSIEAVTAAVPAVIHRGGSSDVTTSGDIVAATAVLAHTLLNSIAVVRGGTELLARHHETLPPAERHEWYRRVDDHAEFLAVVLERLAQGRLADALDVGEQGCQSLTRPQRRPPVAAGGARSAIRPA
jgi:hypothetical protein